MTSPTMGDSGFHPYRQLPFTFLARTGDVVGSTLLHPSPAVEERQRRECAAHTAVIMGHGHHLEPAAPAA